MMTAGLLLDLDDVVTIPVVEHAVNVRTVDDPIVSNERGAKVLKIPNPDAD